MQRLFRYMLTSLDRVGRRSSNLALYFGLAPVREQRFEQLRCLAENEANVRHSRT